MTFVRIAATVLAVTVLAVTVAPMAQAQEEGDARFKVGITGGTLGIGPEASVRVSNAVGLRANATMFNLGIDLNSDDMTYDADVRLRSAGVMVDVYPFGGGFHLSGGVRFNGNRAKGEGAPQNGAGYSIGGRTYSVADIGRLEAETDVKGTAPALTIGYGGGRKRGLVFGVEAGVLFQGSVAIKPLTYSGLCSGPSAPPTCATLADAIEKERQSINDDIDGYKVYPILQMSVGYRF